MKFEQLEIKDIVLIKPDVFYDNRGYFYENYNVKNIFQSNQKINSEHWKPVEFVQDNVAYNDKKNTIRGMHYQENNSQAKLVSCLAGSILDVVIDIRKDSSTFGKWVSVVLSQENNYQLWIPKGFAHGYRTLTDECVVIYKTDDFYNPDDYRGIMWNDLAINIDWGIDTTVDIIISEQDTKYKEFKKRDW